MAPSNKKSANERPRRLPSPGSDADPWLVAHYLMGRCDLTAQQIGALIGCSSPTVYRVLNKNTPQDAVASHLMAIWALLSGTNSFGQEVANASLDERIKIVQRLSRQTPSEVIWRTGLGHCAGEQLEQMRRPEASEG
jgi:hypothetical protein